MALLRVAPEEQKSSVPGIEFCSENTIKIMQSIGKYFALIYGSTAC
jgi:hypothetical protein